MKIAFVSWGRPGYQSHTDLLAQHLNADLFYVSWGKRGRLMAPVRYIVQAWKTWWILCENRPDVIFTQNPPIFSVLVAFFYSRRFGAQYVIDSHSGAFIAPRWRIFLKLHRLLSRGALTTIVHNKYLEEMVRPWGCRYSVLGFIPGDYPSGDRFPLGDHFTVAVISSFLQDEPTDVVIEAARRTPEVHFYVTGDSNRLAPHLLENMPDNFCLTGYLPTEQYVGLLRAVDVVMVLTTQNHTLLMGAFEAVSLGTPLIVSDWPILRGYFSLGTVYVPNTIQGICEGVRRAKNEHVKLKQDILVLHEQLQTLWQQKFAELQKLLLENQRGHTT